MAFNKNAPAGSTILSVADDIHREQYTALEDALTMEHDFQTGGTQTGRHKFRVGPSPEPAGLITGELFFNTDIVESNIVMEVWSGSEWTTQFDLLLGLENTWGLSQSADWTVLPIDTGITPDFSLYNFVAVSTAPGGLFAVADPVGHAAGSGASFVLEITSTNIVTTFSWGNEYVFEFGTKAPITGVVGAVDLYFITRRSDGKYHVTPSRDSKI